jgi:dienelactone hydrolase
MPNHPDTFDSHRWSRAIARQITPRYSFQAADVKTARRWQSTLRHRFVQRLGGFPAAKAALRPRSLQKHEYSDYTREEVAFQSREGLSVFAHFLLPKEQPDAALPALICLPGHGHGADALVGIDAFGKECEDGDYHHDFALQAVRHGYAVLAMEMLGFGRRREQLEKFAPGSRGSSCLSLGGAALMQGQTLAGWRTYDVIRALDYLETRREVNARKIGVMGISGGGLVALFSAAVETRLRAAVVSGYLNTFRDSVMTIPHCIDNFVPGLICDAEMTDLAGLIAPRALWCESGSKDEIFPVTAFRRALREAKRIYRVFDAGDNCDGEVFEGSHQFCGKGAWTFLEKHLK